MLSLSVRYPANFQWFYFLTTSWPYAFVGKPEISSAFLLCKERGNIRFVTVFAVGIPQGIAK